jgi:hypothetical protein
MQLASPVQWWALQSASLAKEALKEGGDQDDLDDQPGPRLSNGKGSKASGMRKLCYAGGCPSSMKDIDAFG